MFKFVLHIATLLMPVLASSQYIFNSFTKKDGLSAKEATSLFQDREGFMWIGTTTGLNRYDGTRIKTFNKAHNNLAGLANEYIMSMAEPEPGKLAIGTRKELVVFDKRLGTIAPVHFINKQKDTIKEVLVTSLLKEPKHLWIATDKGLFVYKGTIAVPAEEVFSNAIVLKDRYCIKSACVVDSFRNGLWIGTTKGLFFLNYVNGTVTSVKNSASPLFDSTTVASLALDAKHHLWISSESHLLSYYDFNKKTFTDVKFFDPLNNFPVIRMSSSLIVDPQQNLWITNDYFKIFVLTKDGRRVVLPDQSPQTYKPAYGFFQAAITDRSGNFWLATPFGVSWLSYSNPLQNVYDISADSRRSFSQPTSINNFKKGPDGLWWICKYDGLYSLNESSGVIDYFIPSTSVSNNRFFDLAYIKNEWWCATGNGIQIFNLSTKTFRPFDKYPLCNTGKAAVVWIFEDEKKNVWFACWKDAIYRYDPLTNSCTRYADSTTGNSINSLCYFIDRNKKIWFGFGEKGLRQYDAATGTLIETPANKFQQLNTSVVYMMAEDSKSNMYVATGNGVVEVNPLGKSRLAYTTEQGLPSNLVSNLFVDPLDNVWTVYDDDIFYKRAGASSFSSFKVESGMPFIADDWSQFKSDGKNLYISLIQKFAVIDYSKLSASSIPSSPIISNISVFEKDIPFSLHDPELNLSSNENFLVIDFSLPPGNNTPAAEYAYKLVGYDKDWVYCGTRQNAVYTSLPDGEYSFLVKATIQKNQWNTPVASMKLSIAAPFYKTLWFFALAGVSIACLIYWLYGLREKNKRKKYTEKAIDYFANSIYGENSVTEICWDIARNCISQLRLEDCVVYLVDEKTGMLVQKAAYGPKNPKEHEISNPIAIKMGEGIVGVAAVSCKPVLIRDTTKDSRYIVDDEARLSELAVPIIHEGQAIGVIDSEHPKKNFFGDQHIKVLSTIAAISANKIAEAKAEEAARESQIQLLEIKKLLAESQLMALRAQMNPHFVFNCLNSIQECIVTQKYGEASLYLNKFAKLFRSVLNNSGRVFVTLAEEIEVLDLYLTLEHMRFEKSFTYNINTDEELEADEILIPSMLLQPYVENALWHGLMHKEGDRQLTISFNKKTPDIFECIIEDNGIGRKKALELKEQQSKTKRHVSKGMTISKDRIELLQKQGQHAELSIIDKYDDEKATGTKVVIELSSYLQ